MKISIITSCYNRASTIRSAMDSVLSQDYPEIEYIVVDGASTDGSIDVIREIERLTHTGEFRSSRPGFEMKVICEPDGGMYEAVNKGIRAATGDIVGLVHSDDFLYSPHTLSRIAARFSESHADFLYGDGLFVSHDRTDNVVRNWIGGKYRLWKVRHGWLPLHPTCYIRRSVMERKGLYNESYKIAADSDLLFRYLVGGELSVTYLPEYIVRMRMGGLSTDSARRKQMWREDVRMYSSHGMNPVLMKLEKMLWKLPQFIEAKFK
ncbi:glycosyltransferase [Palleniella muris]|uniref:Glycosyltransferase n=1 Tax=Palleniella muris TaxID=3038145 RepID=A0AC61QQ14_9BACT|nr:glycosyltransferase family 2 protein [Palleniella muris]TGX82095.1 glycosyltransferase [Palleniella muris]